MSTKAALSLTLSSSLCLSLVPSSRAIRFKRVGIKSIEMMSCDFKSTAYLSHRLKGSWIKNHAITIHAGYGLRVQFSEHICVLRAVFPTIKKKRSKVNASFLKGDSSAVSEEVFKRACNKIPKTKRGKKRGWNAYFLKETYEMLIISFQPPPAKKKMVQKWFDRELWKDVLPMAMTQTFWLPQRKLLSEPSTCTFNSKVPRIKSNGHCIFLKLKFLSRWVALSNLSIWYTVYVTENWLRKKFSFTEIIGQISIWILIGSALARGDVIWMCL